MIVYDKALRAEFNRLPMIEEICSANTIKDLTNLIAKYPKDPLKFNFMIFAYACRRRKVAIQNKDKGKRI